MPVRTGISGEVDLVVASEDTAIAFRSGDVPVLATPRIVALVEEACCLAIAPHLAADDTSVGMRVELAHLQPVPVGGSVRAEAVLERAEGRRLTFTVSVKNESGLVAAGKVTRVLVTRDLFLERATNT